MGALESVYNLQILARNIADGVLEAHHSHSKPLYA